MRIVLIIIILIFPQGLIRLRAQVSQGELKVTCISNSGFLLTSHNHKVLIDALFSYGATSLKEITTGIVEDKPPFDSVNIFLLSHYHADHCDPQMVNLYLSKHPDLSFVASKPAISFINGVCYDFILLKKQFCELTPEVNRSVAATVKGITVKAFGLKHNAYYRNGIDMNESMLNVSFLFEMDGISIFHSGDIKTDALQGYLAYNSKWTDRIDVALLCYGLFESDEKDLDLVVSTLHPKYIVVMHVPSENIKTCEAKIENLKNTFPDIVFLKNRMESRTLTIKDI